MRPLAAFWRLPGQGLAALLAVLLWTLPSAARADCRDEVPWQAVGPGVWVWPPAADGEIDPANAGHVVPTTVIVHGRQALLIDPGPSRAHGLRVRQSLACRFGAQVRWIVNTHAHAENVLGNAAFADRLAQGRLQILANAATRAGMARRCPDCLASLTAKVGTAAMAGTHIVLPSRTLREGEVLRLGSHSLQVLPTERGHTDGDLLLWEPRLRLLWAGGLVYGQRLPELAQGSVDGWLAALDRLAALRPSVVLGNTVSVAAGPDALPPALLHTRQYLADLRAAVLGAMDAGQQAHEAGGLALPPYAGWVGYAERQGFNAQRAWRELEPVWMERGPEPASVPQDVGR